MNHFEKHTASQLQLQVEKQLTNWSAVYPNIDGLSCPMHIRYLTVVDSINVQTIITEVVPLIQPYVSLTTSTSEESCSPSRRRNCTSIRVVPPSLSGSRAAGLVDSFAKQNTKCCQTHSSTVWDVMCTTLADGQPNIWETADPQDKYIERQCFNCTLCS